MLLPLPDPTPALALALGVELQTEALPAGALDVGPVPVPVARLDGRVGLWPDWALAGWLSYREYTLLDRQAPDSRHHRDEFGFGGQLAYRLPIAGVTPWVGVGYTARYVGVVNSVAPPLSDPLLFSPAQLFHGPRVAAGWQRTLRPGFQLDLEGGFRPYLFAAGDVAVASLAPLWGYDADAGITWTPGGPGTLRVGLAYDSVGGYYNDFRHIAVGPLLRGSWRF